MFYWVNFIKKAECDGVKGGFRMLRFTFEYLRPGGRSLNSEDDATQRNTWRDMKYRRVAPQQLPSSLIASVPSASPSCGWWGSNRGRKKRSSFLQLITPASLSHIITTLHPSLHPHRGTPHPPPSETWTGDDFGPLPKVCFHTCKKEPLRLKQGRLNRWVQEIVGGF